MEMFHEDDADILKEQSNILRTQSQKEVCFPSYASSWDLDVGTASSLLA